MTELELDPNLLATLQMLEAKAVEYVLIGEVAEAIHNGGGFISTAAIVPGGYGRNVDRLATALDALDATHSDGRPIDFRVTDLRAISPVTIQTKYMDVDLDFFPGGTRGYSDLFDDAGRMRLAAGVSPHVASPEDLERIGKSSHASAGSGPPAVVPRQLPPEPDYRVGPEDFAPEHMLPDPGAVPPATPPTELPPAPPAAAPRELPPEPRERTPEAITGWGDIRASRASRR